MFGLLLMVPALQMSPLWMLGAPLILAAIYTDKTARKRLLWALSVVLSLGLLVLPAIVMRCPEWWIFCW